METHRSSRAVPAAARGRWFIWSEVPFQFVQTLAVDVKGLGEDTSQRLGPVLATTEEAGWRGEHEVFGEGCVADVEFLEGREAVGGEGGD